jgi:predicted ATPase/DNA-binding NarL/FixJ family response regulator
MDKQTSAFSLPLELTSFVGRERERVETKQLLANNHLLTLTGAGGCGKTRLALRVATDLANNFADGICWIDLAPLNDGAFVPQAVVKTLNLAEQTGNAPTEVIVDFLCDKEILFVLDNCEHLLSACAELVQNILRDASDVRVLATSREPLAVTGETIYPVSPLALPPSDQIANLEKFDAIHLFVERAHQVLPSFVLATDNALMVVEICRRLDGIPLAIELASARVNVLSLEQIAARLDNRFSLLIASSRNTPSHHHTLRATIDWSFDLLAPSEQILFRRLAVFAGGCTLDVVEAVCTDDLLAREQIAETLFALVNKSLVVAETLSSGAARYHFLETIRQYAQEKLDAAGESTPLRNRFLNHLVTLAENEKQKLYGPYQKLWLGWFEREQDNFRSALEWAMASHQSELAFRLAIALYEFWSNRGYVSEGLDWSLRVWENRDESVSPRLRANIAVNISFFAAMLSNAKLAVDYGKLAVEVYEKSGEDDKLMLTMAYGGVSGGARSMGDHATAYEYGERALNVIREINHPLGLGMSLISQGDNAIALGRFEKAHQLLNEGLQIVQQMDDTFRIALAFNYLGDLERCEGNFARAQIDYENSLARYRENDSKRELAGTMHNLAYAVLHQNQVDYAADLFKQSLQMDQSQRNQTRVVECLTGFAAIAVQQKRFDQAARLLAYANKLGAKEASAVWAAERMEYASVESAIQKQLSSQQWQAAQFDINGWSIEQAIEYALSLSQVEEKLAPKSVAGLSARELEIVALIADGKSNIEIAGQLVLSKRTVEKHVANIHGKLDFTNRTQVARWATENKLTLPKQ